MKEKEIRKVEVSVEAVAKKTPDKAFVSINIVRKGRRGLQEKMREELQKLKEHLVKEGIKDKEIETLNYNIIKTGETLFAKEYTITHDLLVTVRDLSKVGKIIDIINDFSNAEVNAVKFGLDDENFEKLKLEAYAKAGKKLKDTAKAIVSAAGARLGKPLQINETVTHQTRKQDLATYQYSMLRRMTLEKYDEPETDIKIDELHVLVKLQGTFIIG